jgi:hypothetical protein
MQARTLQINAVWLRVLNAALVITALNVQPKCARCDAIDARDDVQLDCSANCLYILARLSGNALTYGKSLELLPPREAGNSLKEVASAVESLGLHTEAVRLSVAEICSIRVPCIALIMPPAVSGSLKVMNPIGHFVVLWPVGNEIVLLDYPTSPIRISRADLTARIIQSKVESVPVLLCDAKAEPLDNMIDSVSTKQIAAQLPKLALPVDVPQIPGPAILEPAVTLTEGLRRSPMAVYSFGDAAENATIKHGFAIHNSTVKPIKIARLEKSCTCTELSADINIIPPGKDAIVTVTVSLARRFTDVQVDAAVYFDSESAVPPALLMLTGTAHGRFDSLPPIVDLGEYRPETGIATRSVTLRPTEFGGTSKIIRVESNSPQVKASLISPEDHKAADQIVQLVFDPSGLAGTFVGQVELYADDDKTPASYLELRANVNAAILVRPSQLLIISRPDGRSFGQLTFEDRDKRKVTLVDAHPHIQVAGGDDPSGKLIIHPVSNGTDGTLTVEISVARAAQQENLSGTAEFQVSVEGEKKPFQIVIPIFYSRGP